MRKKIWLLLSVMVVLSLVLAACSQQAATPEAPKEAPAQEQATEAPAAESALGVYNGAPFFSPLRQGFRS